MLAGLVCLLALVALLTRAAGARPSGARLAAAHLLVLHGVEMLWLVTPAFRGGFELDPGRCLGARSASAARRLRLTPDGELIAPGQGGPHGAA